MTLNEAFNSKLTENGDIAFTTTGNNNLLNILFLSEYYQNHLNEVQIGRTEKDKLFSMMMRDPRHGLGRRDLGRELMSQSGCNIDQIVSAGRVDDLFIINKTTGDYELSQDVLNYLYDECFKGNELVKKWMPRYSSKNLMIARAIAKHWGMNKQQYGKFIKCNTVENKLSRKTTDEINFEHVPSLAMIKYYNRFATGKDTSERFEQYLSDVKSGKKELKVATTTVYDIYRNQDKIDPDLFFDKIEKIALSCVPVVDTSGSMTFADANDAYGKAMAIGHYLAKCSTYAPNQVVSFSSRPTILTLGKENMVPDYAGRLHKQTLFTTKSTYKRELESMYTGDCSNTDLGKVMECFERMYTNGTNVEYPEYIVILSDMEFDMGSSMCKDRLMKYWKDHGYTTKIVWWNLNARNATVPEMDNHGNIYMSGYSPMLLKFLGVGFDGNKFLDTLLNEYEKVVSKN